MLYWSAGNIYGAKLKENMLELDSDVDTLGVLPTKGLKEGPYMFERNGIYYLTYPHVENKTERLEYATGKHPLGPFKFTGVIMDESPTGCWTNHHSILPFNNQWYLFYHHNDYSPEFDKARSVRIDSLLFNADGSIRKVLSTLRGVGITDAKKQIQIDRHNQLGEKGSSIDFIDTLDRFKGWKTSFSSAGAWVQYNSVDFGKKALKKISINAMSSSGGTLEVHTQSVKGPLIAEVKINPSSGWSITSSKLLQFKPGIQHLFIVLKYNKPIDVDWISFE
jgi:Glycosyl hydrolases family 43/Carbohydrate binding module (family 6)